MHSKIVDLGVQIPTHRGSLNDWSVRAADEPGWILVKLGLRHTMILASEAAEIGKELIRLAAGDESHRGHCVP